MMKQDGVETLQLQRFAPGEEAIEALSAHYDEPAWMQEARHEAWQLYRQMDLPNPKEEAWRRTPARRFPLESARVALPLAADDMLAKLPPCWHYTMAQDQVVAGTLIHCDGALAYARVRPEDAQHGVVFTGLHQALQTHGELIRRYWMRGPTVRPDFNKFTALHGALWHGGTFVYVPEGVRVARSLQSLVSHDVEGGTALHHTLVIAEKGSRVTLIQDHVSREQKPELGVVLVEIYAEAGAWVRYIHFQHWGGQRHAVTVQDAVLKRGAHLVWVSGAMGGRMVKDFMRTELQEAGARALMRGFVFARGQQRIDQSTYQHHRAPETFSDLLFRNVLRDRSRTVFYGMIRVEPEAQHAEGYQATNNLLLDGASGGKDRPRAHAIPGLEIAANDVRCSHGATVSRIDPEQLFYLQARGIPRQEAEGLIVQGFLHPIVERVPLAYIRRRLEREIMHRFWAIPSDIR